MSEIFIPDFDDNRLVPTAMAYADTVPVVSTMLMMSNLNATVKKETMPTAQRCHSAPSRTSVWADNAASLNAARRNYYGQKCAVCRRHSLPLCTPRRADNEGTSQVIGADLLSQKKFGLQVSGDLSNSSCSSSSLSDSYKVSHK